MKKNYAYIIAPVVGLAIFTGIYLKYSSGYEARVEETKKREKAVLQAKLDQEALGRKSAADAAFIAQEKRKKEKAAKEAKDIEDRELREKAAQIRNKAVRDAEKMVAQVKRLTKEITDEKAVIAKVEEEKKRHVDESAFLRDYVKKAEDNSKSLLSVLDKIAEADRRAEEIAREQARINAAAAKKQ